ncbi:MAG: AMP-binding protein [Actinomycetes bacterium]
MTITPAGQTFRDARDLLLECTGRPDEAYQRFSWPELEQFNWALDWFDALGRDERRKDQVALRVLRDVGTDAETDEQLTFAELSERSSQVAVWLRDEVGVRRGDRTVVMLGNQVELWETMLALFKLSSVVIPATTLLGPADLRDRIDRGHARHVVVRSADAPRLADVTGDWSRIAEGEPVDGWLDYARSRTVAASFEPDGPTAATDPLLLYFTSGTTASPKLVEHTHVSYPVGHLSTMSWIGVRPGDVHLNISSPGWAKHAWSNFFAPWNAEATVLVHDYARFDAATLLEVMRRCEVTTFCAPPTVWRMLIQADLPGNRIPTLRECVGAGEPLNPEVIERVQEAWEITLRDGYGQTETTAQVGNPPGQALKPGSMGKPLPGYDVVLVEPVSGEEVGVGSEGEICLPLSRRPLGLMVGYRDDPERNDEAMRDGYYHTGDVATRDEDGYLTYVGRADDVFKASDYRISPFELESALIEHPAVAEAAVVPSPDPLRLAVPKAYVVLAAGYEPTAETAEGILRHARQVLAPYKRVRRLQFAELPKTISGKIRRVELRGQEAQVHGTGEDRSVRAPGEYWEDDFPGLKTES